MLNSSTTDGNKKKSGNEKLRTKKLNYMRDIRPFLPFYMGCPVWLCKNIEGNDVIEPLTPKMLYEDEEMFIDDEGCKRWTLCLRKLSSMTEEEMKELLTIGWPTLIEFSPVIKIHTREVQKHIKHGLGIGYSTFKENGEHFSIGTLSFSTFSPEQFQYLLSKGFDLFNLIPDLAIDSSTKSEK